MHNSQHSHDRIMKQRLAKRPDCDPAPMARGNLKGITVSPDAQAGSRLSLKRSPERPKSHFSQRARVKARRNPKQHRHPVEGRMSSVTGPMRRTYGNGRRRNKRLVRRKRMKKDAWLHNHGRCRSGERNITLESDGKTKDK